MAVLMNHETAAPIRNHARDNMLAIREKERQLRGRRLIEGCRQPHKEFKMKQFENVKARVGQPLQLKEHGRRLDADSPPDSPGPGLARSTSQPSCLRQTGVAPPCKKSVTLASMEREEDGAGGEDKGDDMDLAAFEAEVERLKQLHGNGAKKTFQKDAEGRPAYLQKIKANLAEGQRRAEAEKAAPKVPAGYRIIPEEECAETLGALKKKREELEKEFQKLPLHIVTDAQKRREKVVMEKIKESENAIKIFSQPRVLVEA